MKKYILLLSLVACGRNVEIIRGLNGSSGPQGEMGPSGRDGLDGSSCSVSTLVPSIATPNGGALITCGSTSTIIVNGSDGAVGATGAVGSQGERGETGASGSDGADGRDGIDGQSIVGATGLQGIQGPAGQDASTSAFSVTELINPCGDSGSHDETFLRLANGQLVEVFVENGNAQTVRLSVLNDGTGYETTDNQKCEFSLSTSGSTRYLVPTYYKTTGNLNVLTWGVQ